MCSNTCTYACVENSNMDLQGFRGGWWFSHRNMNQGKALAVVRAVPLGKLSGVVGHANHSGFGSGGLYDALGCLRRHASFPTPENSEPRLCNHGIYLFWWFGSSLMTVCPYNTRVIQGTV